MLHLIGEVVLQEETDEKIDSGTLPEIDEFDFSYAMDILKDKNILMTTLQDFYKMLGVLPGM